MISIITTHNIRTLIHNIGGIQNFFIEFIKHLTVEFSRWRVFEKIPRVAMHAKDGVMELMPTCDGEYYSFKYVNGHPNNPAKNKLCVTAVGMLVDVATGYPLLISEMTLLTALRTAATSAMAAGYLAKKSVKNIGIIGTGAQSEFQVLAQHALFKVNTVKFFDIDTNAMKKFQKNLQDQSFQLIACDNAEAVLKDVDIITTATASKSRAKILQDHWIKPGLHINGIGGDCPGKTELDKNTLLRAKIVVEYLPQTKIEGEIQQYDQAIYAELWEIITGKKAGRENDQEITLFDSVGFAIEDFAILKFIYSLAQQYGVGEEVALLPELENVKDLFGMVSGSA